jgi:hypothetical protein
MMNSFANRRKAAECAVGLVASYCKGCGLLIAASPRRKTLDIMEIIHHCPVYFHYDQSPQLQNRCMPIFTPRAHLLVYLG